MTTALLVLAAVSCVFGVVYLFVGGKTSSDVGPFGGMVWDEDKEELGVILSTCPHCDMQETHSIYLLWKDQYGRELAAVECENCGQDFEEVVGI